MTAKINATQQNDGRGAIMAHGEDMSSEGTAVTSNHGRDGDLDDMNRKGKRR